MIGLEHAFELALGDEGEGGVTYEVFPGETVGWHKTRGRVADVSPRHQLAGESRQPGPAFPNRQPLFADAARAKAAPGTVDQLETVLIQQQDGGRVDLYQADG